MKILNVKFYYYVFLTESWFLFKKKKIRAQYHSCKACGSKFFVKHCIEFAH